MKQSYETDVLVVRVGPAGIRAAVAAAGKGADLIGTAPIERLNGAPKLRYLLCNGALNHG